MPSHAHSGPLKRTTGSFDGNSGGTWFLDPGGNYSTYTIGSTGGGGSHTHPQTAVGTDSQLSSSQSILPPYLSVYVWQRTG